MEKSVKSMAETLNLTQRFTKRHSFLSKSVFITETNKSYFDAVNIII